MANVRSKMAVALALIALLSACSSGKTVNPEEPATVAELDAAVTTASQALLSNNGVAIIAGYFASDDPDSLFRYDWIDYRQDGALLAVYKYLDRDHTEALSWSAGNWMSAATSVEETHPWQSESLGQVAEVIPEIARLQAMTTQQTPDEGGATATKQTASDGSALWGVTVPTADGAGSTTREWIINSDGIVQFHRVTGDDLGDGATIIVVEYAVAGSDAAPIFVPVAGTPLVLDNIGIPDAVRDLETAEQ